MNPFREQTKGRWKYLFQLAYGINTWCVMHIQMVSTSWYQLCTHSRSVDLDLRLHLGEGLQGLLGRCDGFPVEEKGHSHCVALVRVNPAEFHHLISEAWFWPQDHWRFPVKMFKSTFCGAACSSVGGPMMFSLKNSLSLTFAKCLPLLYFHKLHQIVAGIWLQDLLRK